MIVHGQSVGRPQPCVDATGRRQRPQNRPAAFSLDNVSNHKEGTRAEQNKERCRVDAQALDNDAAPKHAGKAHSEFKAPDVVHSIRRPSRHETQESPQAHAGRRREEDRRLRQNERLGLFRLGALLLLGSVSGFVILLRAVFAIVDDKIWEGGEFGSVVVHQREDRNEIGYGQEGSGKVPHNNVRIAAGQTVGQPAHRDRGQQGNGQGTEPVHWIILRFDLIPGAPNGGPNRRSGRQIQKERGEHPDGRRPGFGHGEKGPRQAGGDRDWHWEDNRYSELGRRWRWKRSSAWLATTMTMLSERMLTTADYRVWGSQGRRKPCASIPGRPERDSLWHKAIDSSSAI